MDAVTKIMLVDGDGEKFFGEGPCRLLLLTEELGSLRKAAISLGMAYSKALRIVNRAEAAMGCALTVRVIGGASGGGTRLTPRGRELCRSYEAYREACAAENRRLFRQFFPEPLPDRVGCVIMASGLGVRFGGNKLMADFGGKPLIAGCLEATGSIPNRVVVTRHENVAEYCRERGIRVVLHALPHRSDTVRLGLEAVGDPDCCMFCQADQPLLTAGTVEAMARLGLKEPGFILRAAFGDRVGAPMLFPRAFYEELKHLPTGKGGSFVAKAHPDLLRNVPAQSQRELLDVDTKDDLQALLSQNWP